MIKWKKGYDPLLIVEELKVGRSNDNGRVSWVGSFPEEWISVILSALDMGSKRSWSHKRYAINRAVWSKNLQSDFGPEELKREISDQSGSFRRKSLKTYRVVFPVKGIEGFQKRSLVIEGAHLNLQPSENSQHHKRALSERKRKLEEDWFQFSADQELLSGLPLVSVKVSARIEAEAFEYAEAALGVFLGLLNLYHNFYRGITLATDHNQTFHKVWWAPFASIHDASGNLATEVLWYNRYNEYSLKVPSPKAKNEQSSEFLTKTLKRIRANSWADDKFKVLFSYYDAFSVPSMETAFLNGWRVLEKIGGNSDTSYDTLRKRGSFMFASSNKMSQVGLHLQQRRNSISHGRRIDAYDDDRLASQMHMFLRPILWSYLVNSFNVRSREEFWEFLDLPTDAKELQRRSKLAVKAASLRS